MVTVEYRDIPGFPGYRVGSDGSIWSRRLTGSGSNRMRESWRPLSTAYHQRKSGGYRAISITLCSSNGRRQVSVAHLVLEAFIGPRPAGGEACHFPDRDPRNNRLDNLRWGTPKENSKDREIHGTTARGGRNGNSRIALEQVRAIRSDAKSGLNLSEVARKHGVGRTTVGNIVKRRTWKHVL